MNTEKLLKLIMKIGRLLMESGAEVYRIEDTMVRVCHSIPEVEEAHSYVTATGIMLSMTIEGKTRTRIERVRSRDVNLQMIDEINSLSRDCCANHYSIEQIEKKLHEIERGKRFSFWETTIWGAMGAMGFAMFFDGNFYEMMASFVIGFFVRCFGSALGKLNMNSFFNNLLGAMLIAWMSGVIHNIWPYIDMGIMVKSSIMLLVPGLAITNAIRDTMSGDYLSGVARAIEAFLCASAIAVGAGLILYIWR